MRQSPCTGGTPMLKSNAFAPSDESALRLHVWATYGFFLSIQRVRASRCHPNPVLTSTHRLRPTSAAEC